MKTSAGIVHGTGIGLALAALAGCYTPPAQSEAVQEEQKGIDVTPSLQTYISESSQIDELSGGPGDANAHVGDDPADNTASADLPSGGPSPFIDWTDLGGNLENHRLLDLDSESGKDPSSFPRSNECVGPSKVLSKMDLTYVGFANNQAYAYIAVQRSDNNGDAGYYWLFNHLAPRRATGEAPCRSTEDRLVYDISGPADGSVGDVLLVGHFAPSSGPLLRFFRAKADRPNVPATAAIDFTDASLWEEDPSMIAAVAVNTTDTDAGSFGAAGVKAASGNILGEEILAEAAVNVVGFTGGTSCGKVFYGSVITRSSGSGGTSPDLKDMAGPAQFVFGGTQATAAITPTCGLSVGLEASATGIGGAPLANPTCSWTIDGTTSYEGCSGDIELAAGSHSAEVTVTDPITGCADTITTDTIEVYEPISVRAELDATCESSFAYRVANIGGGSGAFSYHWTFEAEGGAAAPADSSLEAGIASVATPGIAYTGTVEARDLRGDGLDCRASDSDSATPLSPIAVSISPSAESLVCPMASDGIAYVATVTGGSGNVEFAWHGEAGCSGGPLCLIDPSDSEFCADRTVWVTVTDLSNDPSCGSADSEQETYSKRTTVDATDN